MIETFEIDEVTETPFEDNEEQRKLIESLGLEGQTLLISPVKKSILPYPECTKEQRITIAALCSSRYAIKDYKRMQIPLRVLQVIAHVKDAEYFDELYIFDKASETIKDPFLIGIKGTYYNGTPYLLARWGEHLEDWGALKKKASEVIQELGERFKDKVRKILDCDNGNGNIFLPTFSNPDVIRSSSNLDSEIPF